MSSVHKNLSISEGSKIPNGAKMRIGIVTAEWNITITGALLDGAIKTLIKNGVKEKNILLKYVPGSFELTLGSQLLCENRNIDAVICLGCVIQGETRHFDFICDAVANGITNVSLKYHKPVVFGVLTTDTLKQAQERAGGKHGNKGIEAAITVLKMMALKNNIEK